MEIESAQVVGAYGCFWFSCISLSLHFDVREGFLVWVQHFWHVEKCSASSNPSGALVFRNHWLFEAPQSTTRVNTAAHTSTLGHQTLRFCKDLKYMLNWH